MEQGPACLAAGSGLEGLSRSDAVARQQTFGLNVVTREVQSTILEELWARAR